MTCQHNESLWGRCMACGMTWEQQQREQRHAFVPVEESEACGWCGTYLDDPVHIEED